MREMGVIYVGKYHDGSPEPRGRDDSGGGLISWMFEFSTEQAYFGKEF